MDLVEALAPAGARVVRLFGIPHVTRSGVRTEIPEGSQRLVAFTALCPGGVDRGHTAGALWPDCAGSRASGNLRSSIWRLHRQSRGRPASDGPDTDLIRCEGSRLMLAADVVVDADLANGWAARMIADRPGRADLRIWPGDVTRHDLLPGWYEDWALLERERIRQRLLHGFEALGRRLLREGRCADAVDAALVAVAIDPLRESAQRILLEAHLGEGNWAEANRAYRAFSDCLERELAVRPSAGLHHLLTMS